MDEVDAVKAILKEEMEHAVTLAVPLDRLICIPVITGMRQNNKGTIYRKASIDMR